MNRLYKLSIIGTLFSSLVFAQEQMPNSNFELWENEGTATEEPLNWSSLKTAGGGQAGVAPVVISKDAGRIGGSSVRFENISAFGITANGILTNGRVYAPDFNPENGYVATVANDSRWNTPFTSRPDSIVGWYKFAPVGADKGKVEVVLHRGEACRLPEGTTENDVVAKARFDMTAATNVWKRFSVPFVYESAEDPEYILSVLTSGDSTQAVIGSVAHFDDIELIYNPVSVKENGDVDEIRVFQIGNELRIDNINGSIDYGVYDALGRVVASSSTSESQLSIQIRESGLYLVRFTNGSSIVTRKVVMRID